MYRIGISGSYGGFNLGDEAILEGMLRELRASVRAEVTVFSRDADDTCARHRVDRVVPVRERTREEIRPDIARLDLLILGGGGLLYDASAPMYLREALLAEELGVPVFVYAVSAGPLAEAAVRAGVREALENAAAVTVRDRRSKHLLEEIGVHTEIHVTADPALLVAATPPIPDLVAREGIDPERRLIGVSIREPGGAAPTLDVGHYHQLLASAADFMIDRYDATLVFVPMERRVLDMQHSHAVIADMAHPQRAAVLRGAYTPGELISLLGQFEFALGMRLHFLIFAALQRVPFVALPYGSKVAGFLDELGMSTPHVEDLNVGQLIAYVDRAWDQRRSLREQIEARLPALQERARETNRLLVRVLERGQIVPARFAGDMDDADRLGIETGGPDAAPAREQLPAHGQARGPQT
jgi:polysaccharide pyruvyl transferase CsaB